MKNPLFQKSTILSRAAGFNSQAGWRDARRSFALVIVLIFIVLLTAVVLAFLSNALLLRQVSSSSANETKVNLFAQGALDTIVGDLKQEIQDGSTASTVNGVTIYIPKATYNVGSIRHKYTSIMPAYQGFVPALATLVDFRETDGLNNLLKFSCNKPFYTNSFTTATLVSGIIRGSTSYTTNVSANGRSVSTGRWNKAYLLPATNAAALYPVNYPTNIFSPTWVLVDRSGSNPTNWNANMVASPTATTAVVGRYAYAIYDEGGLLDINLAGYDTNQIAAAPNYSDFLSRRGTLPQVDLSALNTAVGSAVIPDVHSFIQWRNQATAASDNTYTNSVLNNTSGYMTTAQGDQTFISRQALIKYVTDHPSQITPQALQYLGTFSRELNGPSYSPPDGGSPARPITHSGEGYRLAPDPGNRDDQFNPSLINTRVTTSFVRWDGTTAMVGEPLIKSRFPLSRLSLVTQSATDTGSGNIYKYFGLQRSSTSDAWVYNHGTVNSDGGGSSILYLSEVATLGREPDFFELLQAAIYAGSLGKQGPTAGTFATGSDTRPWDANPNYQIMQIGANLIDQCDADSYPTRVSINNNELDGIENLPYLNSVFRVCYRLHGTAQPANHPNVGFWYIPLIWNPHANAGTLPVAGTAPTEFCFQVVTPPGSTDYVEVSPYLADYVEPTDTTGVSFSTNNIAYPDSSNPSGLQFTNQAAFAQPTALTPSNCKASGNNLMQITGTLSTTPPSLFDVGATIPYKPDGTTIDNVTPVPDFCGINIGGIFNGRAHELAEDSGYPYYGTYVRDMPSPSVNFVLQYKDPSGNWIAYSQIRNQDNYWADREDYNTQGKEYHPRFYTVRVGTDPRSDRFGGNNGNTIVVSGSGPGYEINADNSPLPVGVWSRDTWAPVGSSAGCNTQIVGTAGIDTPGWSCLVQYGTLCFTFLSRLNVNITGTSQFNSEMNYTDPDGSMRGGDGFYSSLVTTSPAPPYSPATPLNGGLPLALDNTINSVYSRPIVLNRPFRSVGEMGYASRGMPWKSLDFFTPLSADAALLDLFCLNEAPAVVAGKVNLNTRQFPVIQTLFSGAIKSDPDNYVSTTADAANLATNYFLIFKPTAYISQPTGLNDSLADPAVAQPTIAGPLLNKNQLVTRWSLGLTNSISYTAVPDRIIKRRREAAVRALTDVGSTRTWNLLIDLIAQTGRYGPSATSLDNFMVEGERRIWLHVAIDRYTGKVISQYMEPVYE